MSRWLGGVEGRASMTLSPAPVAPVRDLPLGDFRTERGETIRHARLRYRTYGDPELGAERGWVLVFHALTGSHEVHQWWAPLLEPGKPLDPSRRPILAANLLGGCYGSSGPSPGDPGADHFPDLTSGDLARAHGPLLEELGITHLALATGGSLGGMVAIQWARLATIPTESVVVFAAPARTSAQAIGWNAAQRLAIEADPRWKGGRYTPGEGPTAGLAAARAIAMITYRSAIEFETRFGRRETRRPGQFDAEYYLRRQGEKLVGRFDAASYVSLMRSMDLHDVRSRCRGPGDGSAPTTSGWNRHRIPYTLPKGAVGRLRGRWTRRPVSEIASPYGHDAFLTEWDQVVGVVQEALNGA
jgi:homoserine O-acetyltransferase